MTQSGFKLTPIGRDKLSFEIGHRIYVGCRVNGESHIIEIE